MSFRWYGENDPISLEYIRQIPNMRTVVSAVYYVKPGEVWPEESLEKMKEQVESNACYRASRGRKFPGGNSFIVYPVNNGPQYSVRGYAQRCGIYDYELLKILGEKSPEKAEQILDLVCRDFSDYESDAKEVLGEGFKSSV